MRRMFRGEKLPAEGCQHGGQAPRRRILRLEEGAETTVQPLHTAQRQHEVAQVRAVESSVHEAVEMYKLPLRGVAHEVGRGVVQEVHQAVAVADDRPAVAPGDRRSQEARNLAVGTLREAVRHGNRVAVDEFGPVVAVMEPFEQLPHPIVTRCGHRTS